MLHCLRGRAAHGLAARRSGHMPASCRRRIEACQLHRVKDWGRIVFQRDKTRRNWMGFAHLAATTIIINLRIAEFTHRSWEARCRLLRLCAAFLRNLGCCGRHGFWVPARLRTMLCSRGSRQCLLCRPLLHDLGGEPPLCLVWCARLRPVEVAAHLASRDRGEVARRIRPVVQRPAQPRRGHLHVVQLRPDRPRDAGRQRHGRAEQRRPARATQRQDIPRLLVAPQHCCPLLLPFALHVRLLARGNPGRVGRGGDVSSHGRGPGPGSRRCRQLGLQPGGQAQRATRVTRRAHVSAPPSWMEAA